jgi:hypothetical protein
MNYRQEMDALGRHLGAVLATGGPLTGPDVDAGVVGFNATVELIRTVYADVVGPVGERFPRDVAEVEQRPVYLMGRLLHDLPRLEQVAPTDIRLTPVASKAGVRWREVARYATVAEHTWTTSLRASRPTGEATRAEVAQLAALTEGLAAAGEDLAGHLRTAGRTMDAARLHHSCTRGLRTAAAAARQASTSTNEPHITVVDLAHRPERLVILVRRPSHLSPAMHRLAELVVAAGHLSPQHVQLIARATSTVATAASRTLAAAGQREAAAALRAQARQLGEAAGAGRRIVSITPSDPAPLEQARQLHAQARDVQRGPAQLSVADAVAVVGAMPEVTRTLADRADHEIARRTWLAPAENAPDQSVSWTPISFRDPSPLLVDRLHAATDPKSPVGPFWASNRDLLPGRAPAGLTAHPWPAVRGPLATHSRRR